MRINNDLIIDASAILGEANYEIWNVEVNYAVLKINGWSMYYGKSKRIEIGEPYKYNTGELKAQILNYLDN